MSRARGIEPGGAEEDEFFHTLGVAQGEVERDPGSHREAPEVGFLNPEVVHELDDKIGEEIEAVILRIVFHRAAMPGQVGGDEGMVWEIRESGSGLFFTSAESVKEDEWFCVGRTEGGVGEHLRVGRALRS